MKTQGGFREILREKMGETPPSSSQKSIPNLNSLDPLHMAFLLGNVQKREPTRPQKSYPQPKIRPHRRPHNFTTTQRHSFEFLKSLVLDLNEGFSSGELKKAFRQAAKILHPDSGGSAILFMDLKAHYECLKCVVAK